MRFRVARGRMGLRTDKAMAQTADKASGGKNGAKELAIRLLGDALKSHPWESAAEGVKDWHERFLDVVCSGEITDAELIEAVKLLKAQCGLAKLIEKKGIQELWDSGESSSGRVALGLYCYRLKRLDFLDWLMKEGDLRVGETGSGRSLMAWALSESADFLLWMACRGGDFGRLEKELKGQSIYCELSECFYWSSEVEEICNRAYAAGADPWRKDAGGRYPIVDAMGHEEGVALWMLDHGMPGNFGAAKLGELLGAARASGCGGAGAALVGDGGSLRGGCRVGQGAVGALKGAGGVRAPVAGVGGGRAGCGRRRGGGEQRGAGEDRKGDVGGLRAGDGRRRNRKAFGPAWPYLNQIR